MRVEREKNEIVIRISSEMDSKKLQQVLDLIRYGELTSKSTATQEQIDKLASDINKNWWTKNKGNFLR